MNFRKILFLIFLLAGIFNVAGFVYAEEVLNDGILVKGSSEKVYFMENGMKRWLISPEIFDKLYFDWNKIQVVSDEMISAYPSGLNLDNALRYPEGVLIREKNGTKVFLVKSGVKNWIKDEVSFVNMGLRWDSIFDIPSENIKKIYEGKPIEQNIAVVRPITILKKKPNDVVEDILVDFEFTAVAANNTKNILFETFLDGFDKAWVPVYAQTRKISLPSESKLYTFFVRAKYKDGGADLKPEKHTFLVKLSPFFRDVRISSVKAISSSSEDEYVLLTNNAKIPIKVTGWSLGSEAFNSQYIIPNANEIPNYANFEYKIDINLNPSDKAYIYSGRSPSGYSFKMNKCVGYLNNTYNFSPRLVSACPMPIKSEIDDLSVYCQKKISQLSACKEPNTNDILLDNECRAYMMSHFNYTSCVNANRPYYDFFQNEWRVYFGAQSNLWKDDRDVIILRDKNGLIVDIYK